jgi:hypothetical protein
VSLNAKGKAVVALVLAASAAAVATWPSGVVLEASIAMAFGVVGLVLLRSEGR